MKNNADKGPMITLESLDKMKPDSKVNGAYDKTEVYLAVCRITNKIWTDFVTEDPATISTKELEHFLNMFLEVELSPT